MKVERLVDDLIECARSFERLPTQASWQSLHAARARLLVHHQNETGRPTSTTVKVGTR